jgi:hypothetical protein
MLIHLNKYMEGVCNNLYEDSKLESTLHLRTFTEKSLSHLDTKVNSNSDNTDTRNT